MTDVTIRNDFDVLLIDTMGDDHRSVQAARTSTQGADSLQSGEGAGLINRLIADRHGVPFEHMVMQWMITAPIFVWREFVKHRHISMSEQSGRYMQLAPVFYVASPERPMAKVEGSRRMDYQLEFGSEEQFQRELIRDCEVYKLAYANYEASLADGVLPEKARTKLPVAIFSTAMITMNVRAVMHFLSLRVRADDAKFPSKPQWEINRVADAMERDFAHHFPVVHAKFVEHGRVCP